MATGSGRAVDRLPFTADQVRGRAVLVHTGWDRHWRTDAYHEGHPYVTGELAEGLVNAGAALVSNDRYGLGAMRCSMFFSCWLSG